MMAEIRAPAAHAWPLLCASCGAPLADDQRYCVDCGARRAALPAEVAAMIDAIARRPAAGASPARGEPTIPPGAAASRRAQASRPSGLALPSVCAATLASICALGLGVVAGNAATTPGSGRTSEGPLLAAVAQSVAISREQAAMGAAAAAAASTPPATPPASVPTPTPTPTPTPAAVTEPKTAPATTTAPKTTTPAAAANPVPAALPNVKHVFLVMLSDNGFNSAFGPASASPYLASTLTREGELLPNYYAVTSGELANEIAVISGQGPTPQTAADCPQYDDLSPGSLGTQGQTLGGGCVYPATTKTLPDELTAGGQTWRAYVEDASNGGPGVAAACRHPTVGSADPAGAPVPGDAYVTWGDPFVYFHSLIDSPTCATDDVGLGQLASDLKADSTTPSFSYIVPNRCHDGSPIPCAPGAQAGMRAADAFLRMLVPEITSSPGYKDGGLIAITFDQAPQTGAGADSSACCETPAYPNLAGGPGAAEGATGATGAGDASGTTGPIGTTGTTGAAGTTGTTGATGATGATGLSGPVPITPTGGGGRVGLLLISQFVKPGSVNQTAYNHFSLLASVQDLFELPNIGFAGLSGLPVFDAGVYNAKP
jgi:hypothetical protein